MYAKTRKLGRKITGIFLSFATVAAAYTGLGAIGNQAANMTVNAAVDYGLMDNCQDGVILHAWQWSFNNIKDNMANIAAAGYTSVQTSVIQQAKEPTKGKDNSVWWVFYQPANFTIDDTGNSALGTKAEFKAMCDEAHKYGIHVIVDVVANHLGNQTAYDISEAVPEDIRNDSSCWHSEGFTEINYNDRYSITHGSMGGLPDLNSESSKIQNYVINYLKECIDCGADGFRFDAAKHISVPIEGSEYTFWSSVIPAAKSYYEANGTYDSLYCYGEVLEGTGGPDISGYTTYMSVTENSSSRSIRNGVNSGNAGAAANYYYDKQAGAENSVLWAESHDTYSNEEQETTYVSESVINKTWALVGSRTKASALYFARTDGYRGGNIGEIYSTQCFSKEVAEVNKFHNYFNDQSEYLASSGNIAYNERGTSGVVLVNVSGNSTSVNVKANRMADGTYVDQITGNEFNVSGGYIQGNIGDTGIAVVYNKSDLTGSVSASPETETYFNDTLTVTLRESGTENAHYYTSEGIGGAYQNGDKITVGAKTNEGAAVTLTLTATGTDGKIITKNYEYQKIDPQQSVVVYFDNSSYNWNQVYAYIYDDSVSPTIENGTWPGQSMTYDSEKQLYAITVPSNLVNGRVIFTESASASNNRYPADMQPGLQLNGTSMKFGDGYSWESVKEPSENLVNTSKLSEDKIFWGQTVTVNCSSTGGNGSVEYAVYYKKSVEKGWALQQGYSENASVSIKPACPAVYDVCVKAKCGDTIAKKYMQLIVAANSVPEFANTSEIVSQSIEKGQKATVKCSSTGLEQNMRYAVYYKQTTDKCWKTAQDYSTNTYVEFTPLSATVYNVCIKAKDVTTGTVAKVYMRLTVYIDCGTPNQYTNISYISSDVVSEGDELTIVADLIGDGRTSARKVYIRESSEDYYTELDDYTKNITPDEALYTIRVEKPDYKSELDIDTCYFNKKGTYYIAVQIQQAYKYFKVQFI